MRNRWDEDGGWRDADVGQRVRTEGVVEADVPFGCHMVVRARVMFGNALWKG